MKASAARVWIASFSSQALAFVALAGCGQRETPPIRETIRFEAKATVESGGISEEVVVDVPTDPRSLTIVVEGDPGALYGLASLVTSDGVEQVAMDLSAPPGPRMAQSYYDEEIGLMPGELYQQIRLGTFTHVFSNTADQALPPGETRLRVASDTEGPIRVTSIVPPDDGARVLHVNVFVVSEHVELSVPPAFITEANQILAQARIRLAVDEVTTLRDTGLSVVTDFVEPQESPSTQAAALPSFAPEGLSNDALDLFVVDALPPGVGGLSLGTPGPPLRGSRYYGVVVAHIDDERALGRLAAHELSHFLGLHHVTNTGVSGVVYRDPLGDTAPGTGNLMDRTGTTLSHDQIAVLARSALLVRR